LKRSRRHKPLGLSRPAQRYLLCPVTLFKRALSAPVKVLSCGFYASAVMQSCARAAPDQIAAIAAAATREARSVIATSFLSISSILPLYVPHRRPAMDPQEAVCGGVALGGPSWRGAGGTEEVGACLRPTLDDGRGTLPTRVNSAPSVRRLLHNVTSFISPLTNSA
jgi:hypothetical protein